MELYQLREALEVYVIGEVASRGLSQRELEVLKLQVEQVRLCAAELKKSGKPVLEGELLKKFVTSDLRFHMLLLQAGGNQRRRHGRRIQADERALFRHHMLQAA